LQVIFGTAMFFTGAERVGLIFKHVEYIGLIDRRLLGDIVDNRCV